MTTTLLVVAILVVIVGVITIWRETKAHEGDPDAEFDRGFVRVDPATTGPFGTITSHEEARRECARRAFLTGKTHIADELADGSWRIRSVDQ